MSWFGRCRSFLSRRSRRPPDADLDEELRLHLELEIEKHVAAGLSLDDASRRAKLRLGNRTRVVENTRAVWRVVWWDDLQQDLRLAFRLIRKQWQFSLLVIAILAVGTGANTAVFSVANAVLLKPVPARDPDRLAWVFVNRLSNIPEPVFQDFRNATTTLSGLAGFQHVELSVHQDDAPRVVEGAVVSGNYFTVLGVQPARGRPILADDEDVGRSRQVAVISYGMWHRQYGGAPDAVGRTVLVNGQPFTIIGVAPERFVGVLSPSKVDVWIPVGTRGLEPPSLLGIGRLQPDVTLPEVRAELSLLKGRFSEAEPETHYESSIDVYAADEPHPILVTVAPFLLLLLGLVVLVLLVACFNLASMLLARSTGRLHEIGIRLALGANRNRVTRQLLTEAALLTLMGTASGTALAVWVTTVLTRTGVAFPVGPNLALDATIDWRVFAFACATAVVSMATFALAPVLQATRTAVLPALRREVPPTGGRRLSRTRAALITAQLAISVVLLSAAGLLLESWRNAATTDIGFNPDPVLAVRVNPEAAGYDAPRRRAFYQALVGRLSDVPGAVAASAVEIVPLTFNARSTILLRRGDDVPARDDPARRDPPYVNNVGPGYFRTVGIPLLAGRDFTPADTSDARRVTIVNETLAARYWPREDPVGHRLRRLTGLPPFSEYEVEVIGVVANAKYQVVGEEPRAFAYFSLPQSDADEVTILVRRDEGPLTLLPAVRDLLARVDPNVPIMDERPLGALTTLSLLPITVAGTFVGTLGLLTLLLATIGISGVLLFVVRQRTREIGVRMALGVTAAGVRRLVISQTLRWVVIGCLIGIPVSLGLSGLATSLLYDVSPTDPLAFTAAVIVLACVGMVASLVPARRAVRIDPMTALRVE